MTDHLTRATAIPRHERGAAFAELAEKCYGKDWRKVFAENTDGTVTQVYNMTTKDTVHSGIIAYLMLLDYVQHGPGVVIDASKIAALIEANIDTAKLAKLIAGGINAKKLAKLIAKDHGVFKAS
jgi:hypothetical protein